MARYSEIVSGATDVTAAGVLPSQTVKITGPAIAAHDLSVVAVSGTKTYRGFPAGALRIPALTERIASVTATVTALDTSFAAILTPDGQIISDVDTPTTLDSVWRTE